MQRLPLVWVVLVCSLTACRSPSKPAPSANDTGTLQVSFVPAPANPTPAEREAWLKAALEEHAAQHAKDKTRFDVTRAKAESGDPEAQCELARLFEEGRGVAADNAQAVHWLERSADQGWPEAQWKLGDRLRWGRGVAADPAAALRLYHKADARGYAPAAWAIGECHHEGVGTRKDPTEALRWYRRAAELGDPNCQRFLADILASGAEGIDKNVSEAAQWLRRAAMQGDSFAQAEFGRRCAEGDGVTRDLVEAHMWFGLAAARKLHDLFWKSSGIEPPSVSLARIETQMTAQQIVEAKRRAGEFRAKPERSAPGVSTGTNPSGCFAACRDRFVG